MAHNRRPNRQEVLCPRAAPSHAGASEPGAELLTPTFRQAAADRIILFTPFQVLHAALIVTKVARLLLQVFSDLPFALGLLRQLVGKLVRLAFKQAGFMFFQPSLGRRSAFAIEQRGHLSEMVLGMIPIHHLRTVIEMFAG